MPGYRVNHQCKELNTFTDILNINTEKAIPMDGEMTFDGNATDILDSLRILLGGTTVRMHVSWSVAE